MEFEKQSEIMDMKEEFMTDAMDDAMAEENDEEESDAIVNQVLDELGLDLADKMSNVGVPDDSVKSGAGKIGNGKTAVAAEHGGEGTIDADADLQARLDDLRRE